MSFCTAWATITHRIARTGMSTSRCTLTTSKTRHSTRGVPIARSSTQHTTACRSCTTGGTLWLWTEANQQCHHCLDRIAICVAETGEQLSFGLQLHLKKCITRYLTWADIDMLNRNYNCPMEYSGTEGTIQSHEEYPLVPYNSSYRWVVIHKSCNYPKTGGNGT